MKPSVLVVDDSLTVRMDLAEAFERAGFWVAVTDTLASARGWLTRERFDVVVLDVRLPDGDGVQLLAEVRAGGSGSPPVMLLSNEAEVADRLRGLKTGADDYVGKPYDAGYVVSRAHQLVQKRRRPEPSPKHRVLLIDDSATFSGEMRDALESQGFAVTITSSGQEGLRLVAESPPSIVVVDGVLPDIDGPTVIRRIRLDSRLRHVPCVLLTGSEPLRSEIEALEAGADTYVRKQEGIPVVLARLSAIARSSGRTSKAAEGEGTLGPKRILAVDDSVTYLEALAEAFRGEGYDVIQARSGEEALELLAVQPVDCILLDLVMPGMGGREACRRIKEAPVLREIPLVVLTAVESDEETVASLGAGADDCSSKSADFQVLKARVRAQIRRRQADEEIRRFRQQVMRHEMVAAEARASAQLAATRATLIGELEKRNRELEAFSYSVSHDLKTPLRGIDSHSAALLERLDGRVDGEDARHVRQLRDLAKKMTTLIDDILLLARVSRAELRREKLDVSALALEAAQEIGRSNPARKVRLSVQPGLLAEGDRKLIRFVLAHLLGNAWKFTSLREEAAVEVGRREAGGEAVFYVRDNGAGFDAKYVGKLFGTFQRLHTEEEFPGTGIGLATVRRIIDRHGGRVWADGKVGEGATISWTLPDGRNVEDGEPAGGSSPDR